MATTTVASILTNVGNLLHDTGNVRWTASEITSWLNEGQREIVALKPNAYVRSVATALVAGTKQSLPADGVYLLDVTRNLGTDGATPGKAIKTISREALDNMVPDWHAVKYANATVKHFMYNKDDPTRFYVQPPQPASGQGYVELVYGALPADVATYITVDDIYAVALTNYALSRAWDKDSEFGANKALAQMYYEKFRASVMGKEQSEDKSTPNQALIPSNPQHGGSYK